MGEWLSGSERVSQLKCCGFEPRLSHLCVPEQDTITSSVESRAHYHPVSDHMSQVI